MLGSHSLRVLSCSLLLFFLHIIYSINALSILSMFFIAIVAVAVVVIAIVVVIVVAIAVVILEICCCSFFIANGIIRFIVDVKNMFEILLNGCLFGFVLVKI